MEKKKIKKESWPAGIPDQLVGECKICGEHSYFDWQVGSKMWEQVVPKEHRFGIICLPCFDKMATEKGMDVGDALKIVYFCGKGKTIALKPVKEYLF